MLGVVAFLTRSEKSEVPVFSYVPVKGVKRVEENK